jgi:hypothetical protein
MERGQEMKVLVCDDEKGRFSGLEASLKKQGHEAIPLLGEDLKGELDTLFRRVDDWLNAPAKYVLTETLKLDTVDIALFDNNLAHLRNTGSRLTAESVVGYVRAFTKVGYLVSLNKNPDVDFDLRFLVGDYETRADLAINASHLDHAGLWVLESTADGRDFAPWYWPRLNGVVGRRREQVAFVRKNLDKSVLETLEFPTDEDSIGYMSLHAIGALSPLAQSDAHSKLGKPLSEVTFRDVFKSKSRSLPALEEREKLASAIGASDSADELVARVVAADIDLWFRRDILGPQEMLVDIPHLVVRMPFLLGAKVKDVKSWAGVVADARPPFGLDQDLYSRYLEPAMFRHAEWTGVPALWWPLLKNNDQLGDLFFTSAQEDWLDLVFCEDISDFRPRQNSEEGASPMEFSGEFEGSWARRHVARLDRIAYAPLSRLSR